MGLRWGPKGGEPKFSSFFFPLQPQFSFFLPSIGGLLVELLVVTGEEKNRRREKQEEKQEEKNMRKNECMLGVRAQCVHDK